MSPSLLLQLSNELDGLRKKHRYRSPAPIQRVSAIDLILQGQTLVSFCSNDYLGLASHPDLRIAAAEASARSGFGASASPLVCGTFPEHTELEAALASYLGTEAALLIPSGYQANVGVIPALAAPGDLLVVDRAIHASLIDGCRLSRAKLAFYPHLDYARAEAHLSRLGGAARRRFLVTESLFSMDGDIAPLPQLAHIASAHDAVLVVDEAHALGCLGPSGTGLCSMFRIRPDILIGTLGKAFGASGAFIATTSILREYLLNTCRTFLFSTALPPPTAAAAQAALRLIISPSGDQLRASLTHSVASLRSSLSLPPDPHGSPILPFLLGENEAAITAAATLRAAGILVQPIRPPTVREGTSRLRVTLSSSHTPAHLASLATALLQLPHAPAHRPAIEVSRHPDSAPATKPPLKIPGLVIIGTDTAVGKTTVGAAILRVLSCLGHHPVPFKPVETGAAPQPQDATLLRTAAGREDIPIPMVCPFPFPQPIAPSAAASISGQPLTLSQIIVAASAVSAYGDFLLVESAGGLLTPYSSSFTSCDLAAALSLPLLLVARNSLGTINHTALALSEITRRGLPLLGFILVGTASTVAPDQNSNASQICSLTGHRALGILPHADPISIDLLAASLRSSVDLGPILNLLQ